MAAEANHKTPMPGQIPMHGEPSKNPGIRKDQMDEIRALGARFLDVIKNHSIEKGGDVSVLVVVGAADYLIKTHKARIEALNKKYGQNFLALEALLKEQNLKITEPYSVMDLPPIEPIFEQDTQPEE